MKKFPISLFVGLAAVLLTVVLYFTILGDAILEAIHFVALLAIVLAEGITTLYAWQAKGQPRKVAAAIASAFLIPYAMILSGVYITAFPEGYATYMGLYFAGLIFVNVIAAVLFFVDSAKKAENDNLQIAKGNILMLRKLVKSIMTVSAAAPYAGKLKSIEEELHFTNDNVILPQDEEIRAMLLHLQASIADPDFDTDSCLAKIEEAVKQRTILAARNV